MSVKVLKSLKGREIDPETCPLEELEDVVALCKREEDYFNTMQLSAKTFINSVYGVFGTSFFNLSNIDLAESITLQGQDLIKYSVREINAYFKEQWHKNTGGHKQVSELMKGKYGVEDFDSQRFEELARRPLEFDTLQAYGDTDSLSSGSIIRTFSHPEGISIEDFYNENAGNPGDSSEVGHESVNTDDKVLNAIDGDVYWARVRRIIRHRVTKPKWTLRTSKGLSVECTCDHSLVVVRDATSVVIKPSEIHEGDSVMILPERTSALIDDVILDDIAECSQVGMYDNEYVYDVEVDDGSHTFIANDIVVHNSAYLTMQPLLTNCEISDEQMIKFCLAVHDAVLEGYLDEKFDEYAKAFNCEKNLEKFELEKISRTIIMLAKKNYMCDVAWIDSGIFFDQGHHVTYTGYDVVKGVTTNFCREEMKKFTNFCFEKIAQGHAPTQAECVRMLREAKKRFSMQSPNEIGKTVSISEYEKYVKCDNQKNIEYFDYSAEGKKTPIPIHVRAAATYNNAILYGNRNYLSKYELLRSGDKVRFYYTGEDTVFGFIPDNWPYEFAPPVDIDVQFDKSLLAPLNRIIVAMGLKEVPPNLTYATQLF